MSIVGGSMVTTEGLSRMIEDGAAIVPTYFKFSSQDINLTANLTAADIDGWIQKDITAYLKIDDQTIEFVCDVLPHEAIYTSNLCGMYLPDGTLFMVAKPVHTFPSDLRQTFRIQLVYENASDILDFTYLDLSNTDIRFDAVDTTIALLDTNVNTRIDNVISTHATDRDAAGARLTALESVDTNVDTRIDTLEASIAAEQVTQNNNITALQDNRVLDVQQVTNYISSNDAVVNAIVPTLTPIIDTNNAASIARDDAIDIRIDEILLNTEVGTMATDIAANTTLINTSVTDLTALITANATADAQDKTDVTNLINVESAARIAEDAAINARVDLHNSEVSASLVTVNAEIDAIDALIINNKASADSGIATNAAAILALGGGIDVDALQIQVDMLDSTVSTNNTNITTALATSDTASDTWNNTQDAAIAVNNTFRTDTFPAAQAAQDAVIAANLLSSDTWNTTQDSRILVVENQLTDLPDSVALGLLYDDVDNLKLLTDDFLNGYTPVGLATLATTANKWTTARSITLTGDVTGTVTLDGSANVSMVTTTAGGDFYDTTTSDARYVNVTGDTMTANLNFNTTGTGINWGMNTDGASITFNNLADGDTDSALIFHVYDNGNEFFKWTSRNSTVTTEWARLQASGLTVLGAVNASSCTITNTLSAGTITETSAREYKENIVNLDSALNIVQELDGVRYDWKETGISDIGFIADDLMTVLPELVQLNEDGSVQGMNYGKVTAVLVNAIKEQQVMIQELQSRL